MSKSCEKVALFAQKHSRTLNKMLLSVYGLSQARKTKVAKTCPNNTRHNFLRQGKYVIPGVYCYFHQQTGSF